MQLEVVTPKGAKVAADVSMVTAPGTVGELGILTGHRPLITSLDVGLLSYEEVGAGKRWLSVNGGYMEVHEDHINVITETAEKPEEVDVERAKTALKRADELITERMQSGEREALRHANLAKKRAENRLACSKLAKQAPPG